MKKNLNRLYYLLILLLIPVLSWSQAKLTIESMWSSPMDTVVYNNNNPVIYYTVVIKNIGNDKLDGACQMKTKYNLSPTEFSKVTWQVSNFEVGQTDTVQFNDTIFSLNPNRYKGGDNIIVIWPHTDNPSAQAPDTTNYQIYVDNLTSASGPKIVEERIAFWPNPTNGILNINYLKGKNKIEYVRIVGVDGKLLQSYTSAVESVDLDGLAKGIYLLEIRFKDGLRATYRVSKTF